MLDLNSVWPELVAAHIWVSALVTEEHGLLPRILHDFLKKRAVPQRRENCAFQRDKMCSSGSLGVGRLGEELIRSSWL